MLEQLRPMQNEHTLLSPRIPRDTEHERYHPELEEELKECLFCLKRNEMMFDLEVDTDLIEQRIYERQALLCRYRYLLARARELGAAHRADEISAADMTGRFIGTKILTEGVGCVILVQDKCMVGQSPGMRKF